MSGDVTLLNLDKQDLLQSNRTFIHELKNLLISTNGVKLIEFCFHEVTLILINIDIGSSECPLHTGTDGGRGGFTVIIIMSHKCL